MPELRKDPVTNRWVIISTERSHRPMDFSISDKKDSKIAKFCPFCPGHEEKLPKKILEFSSNEKNKDYHIRVVPNKFPALQVEGELDRQGDGMYDYMNGIGAHEVIIENNNHNLELADQNIYSIQMLFKAYKERIIDLKRDIRLKYILIFKNKGELAGATLEHSHSQLVALPIVPQLPVEELTGSKQYYQYKERCVFCDMIRQEEKEDERIASFNEKFIAIEPFASRQPFETWILPRKHCSHFEYTEDNDLLLLAKIFKEVLMKINKALNFPAYNFVIHNSPIQENRLDYYHWHIEIIPKIGKFAGFEWGTGFYINHIKPEDAANYLKSIEF